MGEGQEQSGLSKHRTPSSAKIIIALQTLVILFLGYWAVEEYQNNIYFQSYVNTTLQINMLPISAAVVGLKTTSAAATPSPAPQATPVSVATVVQSDVATWDEFSGRLEAVERVDIRSRVAGTVQSVHFREGALVKPGELLSTIDPAPMTVCAASSVATSRGNPTFTPPSASDSITM